MTWRERVQMARKTSGQAVQARRVEYYLTKVQVLNNHIQAVGPSPANILSSSSL